MTRKARVFLRGKLAGILSELDTGFSFAYDKDFLAGNNSPISASLPIQELPFYSKELFPFFAGLLPEGWYLNVVSRKYKIDKNDLFGLLLAVCRDTVGAVSIEAYQ